MYRFRCSRCQKERLFNSKPKLLVRVCLDESCSGTMHVVKVWAEKRRRLAQRELRAMSVVK